MLAPHGFFSFTSVREPSLHRAYNEWHQLDHRPENLALDGVRYGERWVRTPALAAQSVADHRLAPTHYVNLYWFRPPIAEAITEWQGLAEQSFQWGRRPDMALCTRPLMGFFNVVKGYVRPEVLVSVDALPFRPVRGVVVQVLELTEPHSLAAERMFHWYDTVVIPRTLGIDGVAGAYTFSSVTSTIDDAFEADAEARTFAPTQASSAGSLRITLWYCDGDIAATQRALDDAFVDERCKPGIDPLEGAHLIFNSAVEPIVPWQWEWFDGQ